MVGSREKCRRMGALRELCTRAVRGSPALGRSQVCQWRCSFTRSLPVSLSILSQDCSPPWSPPPIYLPQHPQHARLFLPREAAQPSLPSSFTRRAYCWRPAARLSRSPLLRSRARRVCHGGSLPSVAGIYIHLPSRGGAHSFTSTNHLSLSFTALTVPSHVPPTTLLSPSLFVQRTLPAGLHRRGLWDGGLQHRGAAA